MFNPIHTKSFDLAYQFVTQSNENIFLTGKAGTGKTTFLKYLRDTGVKNMAVAAPTGVAAINAGGVTLHSMFHIPFGPFVPGKTKFSNAYDKHTLLKHIRYNHDKLEFFRSLELLVIDEVSMVSSFLVDAIDTILKSVRHRHNLPFGGLQILFIGDLYQLQPVIKQDEWQALKEHYNSAFFFDSHVLRNNMPVIIELKEIFRQKDESFIEILNGIRDNNISKENLERLNLRLNRNFVSADGDGYITLTTHNNQADSINRLRLNRIDSYPVKFTAEVEGEFPAHMYPAEQDLVLKENAQVMFIKNDTEEKRYFNGRIGIVSELSEDEIVVRCGEELISVSQHTWENIRYSADEKSKEIKTQVIGTFRQYPLRLAWAITIHKSQGLTFEKVVIDSENAFTKGQVYVALSRATSIEGMVLTSPVNERYLGAHEDLKVLQEKKKDDDSLREHFEFAKQRYLQLQLIESFSFNYLHALFGSLMKALYELELMDMAGDWINQLMLKKNLLKETSDKFEKYILQELNVNPVIEENHKLQKRISDASVYFLEQVREIIDMLMIHPFVIHNRRVSKKLDQSLERIAGSLAESRARIGMCKKGFMPAEFLGWKKASVDNPVKVRSTYSTEERSEESEMHNDLHDMLVNLRKRIARENKIVPYMVFSNAAIKNCCEKLPGNENALLNVGGFGKSKVNEFGDEVIETILTYCKKNNINANFEKAEEGKERKKIRKSSDHSDTVKESIELFKSGKSISEICEIRNLVPGTVEGHLAFGIQRKEIDIHDLLSLQEIQEMQSLFVSGEKTISLKAAREKSRNKFSFGQLRLMQAWIISEKG